MLNKGENMPLHPPKSPFKGGLENQPLHPPKSPFKGGLENQPLHPPKSPFKEGLKSQPHTQGTSVLSPPLKGDLGGCWLRSTFRRCAFAGVALLMCLAAHAQHGPVIPSSMKTPDELINLLIHGDELQRADARQWLRRMDVQQVHRLMPLISHENEHVWHAAYNVLADIANQASVPGREADRQLVAGQVMALVAPEQPTPIKERGLRLLPLIVPEGYDLAPVAALLADQDTNLREKARQALQESSTAEAVAALTGALPQADATFQVALLNSLAQMKRPAAIEAAAALTTSPNGPVRAAAIRAVAWTGDPQLAVKIYHGLLESELSDEDAVESMSAVLQMADAVVHSGNWELAMAAYRGMLLLDEPRLNGPALAGLGRYGDESAVADILAVAQNPEKAALHGPAMSALVMLQGPESAAALREAYPATQAPLRQNLLYLFVSRQDPAYLEALALAAEDTDPATRTAAVEALSASHLAGAIDILAKRAGAAEGDEKIAAVAALERVNLALRAHNDAAGAGRGALQLYQLATTEEQKASALEGIRQYPTPEAFEVIMTKFSEEERAALPLEMWSGIAGALHAAGRTDEAKQTFAMIMAKGPVGPTLNQVIDLAGKLGTPDLVANLGFVRGWSVSPPQPWKQDQAFVAEPPVAGEGLKALQGGGPTALVDLSGPFGLISSQSVFAYAKITLPAATEAIARMGSDDGIALWVNGKKVHENNVDRGAAVDQDEAPVSLQAGENQIIAQITQGGGGWNFLVRFTNTDGTPLQFTEGTPQ